MTPAQRAAVRDVLADLQASGIDFGFQPMRKRPKYTPDMALAEIEKILEDPS